MAMDSVAIRVYAELNSYLPPELRAKTWHYPFRKGLSIRALLRSLAVPVDEVDLVLLNGESVSAEACLHNGDRLSVYPVFESFDIRSVTRMREQPLRTPRFVLDAHLGKLAAYLRMLGFDALYRSAIDDQELLAISTSDVRTLLSRDRQLLADPALLRCHRVRSSDPREQLIEVMLRFDLTESITPFCRCLRCNTPLERVEELAVGHRVPPRVREHPKVYACCASCNRVYWNGSHFTRMTEFIAGVVEEVHRRRDR